MAIFGLSALPTGASAEQRQLQVTLVGGKTFTITLDLPPGTPLSSIHIPGIKLPILSIVELGAPAGTPTIAVPGVPTPEPATTPAPTHSAPAATAPAAARKARKRASTRHRAAKQVVRNVAQAPRAARRSARSDSAPTPADPTYALAIPGPAPVGVPNFFIDKFRIPPFLLPIYQAAGIQYGVRWEILAAINEIETDYGRNLNVSSAGALGWMQFMPATWKRYGVDANSDQKKDPYNPVDAIFAAARYLKAAGAETDIRRALFAYNHADWYVDSVLMRARLIGGMPADLVGSLTGLTEGRFPVAATSRYAAGKRAVDIFARRGAAVIAVQDAKVTRIAQNAKLGRFVQIRDVYGNTYTYAGLARVARSYELPASRAGRQVASGSPARAISSTTRATAHAALRSSRAVAPVRERLQANPQRHAKKARVRRLRVGSRVPGGTILGRIHSHVRFAIRPAGKGAPLIDPKPILDGWKLLESTAIYRAVGTNPLLGDSPTIGQVLLMSKAQLMHRVLDDARIEIYPGGREDIRAGQIDRRVLATLEFLAASGLKPTVSSLKGNHSLLTSSGNISEHASGNAVDISKINAIPIIGHQGAGSITDITIRRLLTLQGTIKPHQIISLMTYQGTDNTLSLPDHADHIHIGFQPELTTVLKPLQWTRLIDRLGTIDNPAVDLG
jgi:hypothetical protein